jgi:hypothetical protein
MTRKEFDIVFRVTFFIKNIIPDSIIGIFSDMSEKTSEKTFEIIENIKYDQKKEESDVIRFLSYEEIFQKRAFIKSL